MNHRLARLALGAVLMQEQQNEATGGGAPTTGAPAKADDPKAEQTKTDAKPNGNGSAKGAQQPKGNGAAAKNDDQAKKDAAAKKTAEAAEKKKAAEKAMADAKRAEEEAAAAEADAQGLVVIQSPARFGVVIGGKITHVEKGVSRVPRAVAEHAYAKNHGVEILGLPVKK